MQAGKMRFRVTIQQLGSGQDSYGQENGTWADYATVWAGIEPLQGREKITAQQIDAEVSHAVTIRYKAGVVPKMRIAFGSRYFNIISVLNTFEQNFEMKLMVTEKV